MKNTNLLKIACRIIFAEILILGQILPMFPQVAEAANSTFTQTDWSGGDDNDVGAVHPANDSNWAKYSEKSADANTATAGKVMLSPSTSSVVDTADADFNQGTHNNTETTGTGAVRIQNNTHDTLRPTLGKWGAPMPLPRAPREGASICYVPTVGAYTGNYIYVLNGNNTTFFRRYNFVTKKWENLAPAPKVIYQSSCMAYPGTGTLIYVLRGSYSQDFWSYDVATDTWSDLTDGGAGTGTPPAVVGQGANLVTYSTTQLYATRGFATSDFWRYNISNNSWTTRQPIKSGSITADSGAVLQYPGTGTQIYLLRGNGNLQVYYYDAGANQWYDSQSAPYTVSDSSTFVPAGDGYLYTTFGTNEHWYFRKFDPSGSGTWAATNITNMPNFATAGSSVSGVYVPSQNKIFYLPGYSTSGYALYTIQLPSFDIANQKWDQIGGGGRDYYGFPYAGIKVGNYFYFVSGNDTSTSLSYRKFIRFNLTTEQWDEVTDLPGNGNYWTQADQLVWAGASHSKADYIYWMSNYNSDAGKIFAYQISTSTWNDTPITTVPFTIGYDADMIYPGSGDIVYVIGGSSSDKVASYNLVTDTWDDAGVPDLPVTLGSNHGSPIYVKPAAQGYLFVHGGYNYRQNFYRWAVGEDSWNTYTGLQNSYYTSDIFGLQGRFIYPGTGDYLYFNCSYSNSSGNKIQISNGAVTVNNFPSNFNNYTAWHYPGSGNYIYCAANNGPMFYRQKISDGSWEKLKDKPWPSNGWLWAPDPAGDVIYFLTSTSYSQPAALLKYTISTNTWTEPIYDYYSHSGFGGGAVAQRVGDYVYVLQGANSRSFWRYNIAADKWEQRAFAPTLIGGGGYLIYPNWGGDYLYAVCGGNSETFIRYSITNDSWTELAPIKVGATYYSINYGAAMAAPGDGIDEDGIFVLRGGTTYDFLRYDLSANSWSKLNNSPQYSRAGTEMIYPGTGDYIYIMMTYNGTSYMYLYPWKTDNPWLTGDSNFKSFPRMNRGYPKFVYTAGDYIYCLENESQYPYLYRYSISEKTWTQLANAPLFTGGSYARLFAWGGPNYSDSLFLWRDPDYQSYSFDAFKYSISDNKWDSPSIPQSFITGATTYRYFPYGYGAMTPVRYNGVNYLYISGRDYNSSAGRYENLFWQLNLDTGVWTQKTAPPTLIYGNTGGDIHYPGSGNYIYGMPGYNSTNFWRYSILNDRWEARKDIPFTTDDSSGMKLADGGDNGKLYLLRCNNSTTFYSYDIASNTWSPELSILANARYGSQLVYGGDNTLYAFRGYNYAEFYKFVIGSGWTQLTSVPGRVYAGSCLVYPGIGDYLYASVGSGSRKWLRYSKTNDSWTELDSVPDDYLVGEATYGGDRYIYLLNNQYNGTPYLRKYNVFGSGDFTSRIMQVGKNAGFGAANWTTTADNQASTSRVFIRTSDSATMSGAPDFGVTATNSNDISNLATVTDKHKYLQYKVELKTTNLAASPEFRDMTVNYTNYPASASLTSSVFDSTFLRDRLMKLSWDETLLPGTDIRFQLSTSPDGAGNWTNFLGPVGTTSVTNDFSTESDYAKSSLVKVESGSARLMKDLEDMQYKQAVTIDNTGQGAGTNVVATINLTAGNSAFWSHVKSDGGDIRFYDPATSAKLQYNCAVFNYTEKSAVVYVKVPTIAAGEVKTIYMLYGSSEATSESTSSVIAMPSPGMVGWYKFNEGNGSAISDSSSYVNSGVLTGGSWSSDVRSGSTGHSLNFSGSGYVTLNNVPFNTVSGNYNTIAFWMKWNGVQGIMAWGKASPNTDLYIEGGWIGYNSGSSERYGPLSTGLAGGWHHVACVVKNGAIIDSKLYIDGVLQTPVGPGAGNSLQLGSSLQISGWPGNYYFQGLLDEFCLYNRELTQSEITALAASGTGIFNGVVSITVPEESTTSPTLGANWPYREVVTLTNSGALKANYVVQVTLESNHRNLWSHAKADGGDIRLVDANNTTLLTYSLDTFDATNKNANIRVIVPSIPASSSKNIYIYYGNAGVSTTSAPLSFVPSTGPVSYWRFEDGSGTTATDAMGANNGTLTNTPTWSVIGGGKFGRAISFNGTNNYIDCGNAAGLQLTTGTIGAWIKTSNPGTGLRAILTKGNAYGTFLSDSVVGLYSWSGAVFRNAGRNLADGNWHHVAATFQSGVTEGSIIYVDGQALYTTTMTVSNQNGSVSIGSDRGSGNYISSMIDEPIIYNRVLSAAEIATLATDPDTAMATFSFPETANAYSITGSYNTSNPVIQPIYGTMYNNDLAAFTVNATTTGSAIKFQFSKNGYQWYYLNGATWTTIPADGGYDYANTAAQIDATALTNFMSQVGSSGEFFYRAYLHSNTGAATPLIDSIVVSTAAATSFYLNSLGTSEGVNSLHTDAVTDRYFRYKATLYSSGEDTPILDDVSVEFVRAYIDITSPIGGEIWSIGSAHNITWNKDGLTNVTGAALDETVKIEYYDGTQWVTEASNAPNTGTYSWTVDNCHTTAARVRITSNGWPVITSTSPAVFRIVGSVNLTNPTGNERWLIGSSQNITWTSSGASQIPLVKLEYSINNGSAWSPVIEGEGTANDGIVTNDGTFSWTVPDQATNTNRCLVRVSDSTDPDTKSTLATPFRIIGAFDVTYPTLGANLVSWATYNVTWTPTPVNSVSIPQVDLMYSITGGGNWMDMDGNSGQVTTVPNNGTYAWYVPNPLSENAVVRVQDHNDSTVYDDSPVFNIRGFQVSTPNGAEEWEMGFSHDITWSSGGTITAPIKIYLSTDGGTSYPYKLKTYMSMPPTPTYSWNITGIATSDLGEAIYYTTSDTAKIKIVDANNRADISNANFRIMPTPAITVDTPVVSDEWVIGTAAHNITWTNTGNISANLAIEYSVNAGDWTVVLPAPTAGQISARSYPWTIPDIGGALPADVQIRIRETSAPVGRDTQSLVSATSATFKIVTPTFTITAPPSGTIWVVGDTSRTITWTHVGTLLDNLKLEYSVDGETWNEIATFTQAQHDGTYNWQNITAGAAGASVLLRISDSRSPAAVTDNSDAITILPHERITLTHPSTGEMLIQGDTYNVTWDWDGQATNSNLTLRFSTDGGTTWSDVPPYMIEQQIPHTPTVFPWTVPNNVDTTHAVMRIYDPDDATEISSLTPEFTITLPQINITAPAADANWFGTGIYNITWTNVGAVSSNIGIQYSIDGGAWTNVSPAPSVGQISAKSYPWVVPDSPASTCQIKITDNSRPVVTKTSDTFNIVGPTVTITSPTGTETGENAWVVGTQHPITWTTTGGAAGAITSLRLQYSTNGTNWTTITTIEDAPTIQADAGTYNWTVSPVISSTVRIKIFDPERVATTATSNLFEIKDSSLVITSPNLGTESWIIGTTHDITWYSVGTITGPLKLYYTTDGLNWTQIADFDGTNDGSFTWTIPNAYSPGLAKIKIEDSYATPHTDLSDKAFTIAYPTISATTPATFFSDTEVATLNWTSLGTLVGPNLKVEWSTDDFGTSTIISQTVPKANTSVSWTVPVAAVSANCKFRVTDLGRTQSWGKSNAFTVLPVPSITITSPTTANTGDNSWRIGKAYNITWTRNNGNISNDLKLQYSLDGNTWVDIAAGNVAKDDGTPYNWIVPTGASASVTAKIRVYDNTPWKAGTNLSVDSGAFEIAIPRINITSPTGTEYWAVGDSAPVTWTTDGFINDDITVQYSIDNGESFLPTGGSGLSNSGSYNWTISDVGTVAQAKVKIIDASSNYDGVQVNAISNAFHIISKPTITLSAPDGEEVYVLGDTLPIRWSSRGLQIENVKIQYSKNNFADENDLDNTRTIVASTANDGVYDWPIPEDALSGATVRVRVSMVGNSSIEDTSESEFRIRGGFNITSPAAAGERRIVGKSETFTWTNRGTIGNVKVLYSATGAAPWTTISSSATNTGSFSVTIPEPRVPTALAKVRIEDASDDTVYAETPAFIADYYTITWRVLDYDTNAPLQQCSTTDNRTFWVDQTSTLSPPVDHDYPYNSYTTFWSKAGYIERSLEWTADSDKTVTIALENQLTAMVQWNAQLATSYSADTDTLKCSAWLERRGKLVGTVATDLSDLQLASLSISDGTATLHSDSTTTHDDQGVYWFTWANTQLEAGKTYFVKVSVSYRDSAYTSGSSIDITSSKKIQETKTLLQQEAIKTAAIQTAVETTLPSKITAAQTSLETKVTAAKDEIKTDTGKILTATETTLPNKIETAKTAIQDVQKSQILNSENAIRSGQTLTIRFRTYSGLSPTLDVYDPKGGQKVNKQALKEIGTTGVYEHALKFPNGWGRGDFTLVCSETTKGTMDALTITVFKTDVEQIYGQVSSILGTTSGISGLKNVADTLNSQFNVIETALSKVGKDLVKEVKDAASSATALESVYTQLSSVAKQIKQLTGGSNVSLEKLYSVSAEKKND
ncbi:MAG: DUF2341 domain-containing protein, partial [Candidatus Omnitrophica bacterium]|nr:DUF2341 domain-containing protein [Candidatus Omnitrophota bacterium]